MDQWFYWQKWQLHNIYFSLLRLELKVVYQITVLWKQNYFNSFFLLFVCSINCLLIVFSFILSLFLWLYFYFWAVDFKNLSFFSLFSFLSQLVWKNWWHNPGDIFLEYVLVRLGFTLIHITTHFLLFFWFFSDISFQNM